MLHEGFTPVHDIYLSFSNNEEIGGDSTPAIVDLFRSRGIFPALVVDEGGAVVRHVFPGVTSPAALVGVSEKGIVDVELEAQSPGGHTSAPPRNTAADRLAKAIVRLHRHPFPARLPRPTVEMLETLGRNTPFLWRVLFANLWFFRPLLLFAFTRLGGEMNAMVRTTLAVTQLEGSREVNVLASRARAAASVRIVVGESTEGTLSRIRKTVESTGVQVRALFSSEPCPVSDTGAPAFALLAGAIRDTFPGAVVSPYVMLGGSDSRHFAKISPFVYRFSPFELTKEERETLHAVNEAIPIEKLKKCVEFYLRLIRNV